LGFALIKEGVTNMKPNKIFKMSASSPRVAALSSKVFGVAVLVVALSCVAGCEDDDRMTRREANDIVCDYLFDLCDGCSRYLGESCDEINAMGWEFGDGCPGYVPDEEGRASKRCQHLVDDIEGDYYTVSSCEEKVIVVLDANHACY
jgi:hypothetical protein